jgi:membrane associated rhomboid family serine protease
MTPWVTRLLVANVMMFLITYSTPEIANLLALYPRYILLRPWGVVTYMFIHAGFGHLFFNMLGLFFFGPRLEMKLGGAGFLRLYLYSGLGGALFSFMFAPFGAVVGASGAVFGILLGFALYWPREQIFIWGVLPVEARWLVTFLAIVALWSGISGADAGVAHFAHLGGFAAGFAYLRWKDRKKRTRRVEAPNSAYQSQGAKDWEDRESWHSIHLEALHELNREEVERLLEKVEALGVKGLTPSERAFLDRMTPQRPR